MRLLRRAHDRILRHMRSRRAKRERGPRAESCYRHPARVGRVVPRTGERVGRQHQGSSEGVPMTPTVPAPLFIEERMITYCTNSNIFANAKNGE